ncbi:resolvase family protein (plasmid) [Corynebacterium mustelae]|uniref:Resolvase family protein n=1 Tax=Corynebacterium mustelae TaxID=571915 RepID=A0A0G3H1U0_9CORY|nr:recombinase family protein [Corynebacterium mustelae]AKK07381.1 resolvase family protein [Corynebacterium mustelae]
MAERLGTYIDDVGRPSRKVLIIRMGKTHVRIRMETGSGKFQQEETRVPKEKILDDGGAAYEAWARNPRLATYIGLDGYPIALIEIKRAYKSVYKVRFLRRDGWSLQIEDVSPKDVIWDSGLGWKNLGSKRQEEIWQQHERMRNEQALDSPGIKINQSNSAGLKISYIRVSSTDQNPARQRELIGPVDKEFFESVSAGGHAPRQQLNACIDYLRAGDTVVVASIDRLARSIVDLRAIVDRILEKDATITFLKEHITFSAHAHDPRQTLMFSILGAFAEFERAIIRERQAEGIAHAKARGVYKGRKKALTKEQLTHIHQWQQEGLTQKEIATRLDVHRTTIYRALKETPAPI